MKTELLVDNNPIFELAPDAYYLSDLRGNFINGNHAAEIIIGYKKEELIGKSFLKAGLLPAIQLPKAAMLLARNALGQATGPDEFVLIRKDGCQIQVEISTRPIKFEDQTVILGIARDITERKQDHRELKYRIEIEKLVNHISARFITQSSENVDKDITFALEKIGEFMDVDCCRVLLITDNGKNLHITHEWRAAGIKFENEESVFPLNAFAWGINKLFAFENISIPDVTQLPPEAAAEKERLLRQGMNSVAAVPMIFGKSLVGFLFLISARRKRAYPEEDIALLRTVSDIVIYALENKKIEFELNKRAEELEKTNRFMVGRELNIIELKREVNALLRQLGQAEKYKINQAQQ